MATVRLQAHASKSRSKICKLCPQLLISLIFYLLGVKYIYIFYYIYYEYKIKKAIIKANNPVASAKANPKMA